MKNGAPKNESDLQMLLGEAAGARGEVVYRHIAGFPARAWTEDRRRAFREGDVVDVMLEARAERSGDLLGSPCSKWIRITAPQLLQFIKGESQL